MALLNSSIVEKAGWVRRHWRIGIALIVLVMVGVLANERISGVLALQSHLGMLKREGAVLNVADLVGESVAAEDNALRAVVALKSKHEELLDLNRLTPSLFDYDIPGDKIPVTDLTEWNRDVFEDCGMVVLTNNWGSLRAELDSASEVVRELRDALAKPGFSIEGNMQNPLMDLPMTNIIAIRWPEKVLLPAAILALKDGRMADLDANVSALIRLVDGAKNDRLLITEMVRRAVFRSVKNLIWETLQSGRASADLLGSWQRGVEEWDFGRANLRALELERACGLLEFERLRDNADYRTRQLEEWEVVSENSFAPGLVPEPSWMLRNVQLRLWWLLWQERDCLGAMDRFQSMIECQKQANRDSWRAARDRWGEGTRSLLDVVFCGREEPGWLDQSRYMFSGHSLSDVGLVGQAARCETERRLLVVGIALKRFFIARSKWPGSLEELVPRFLAAIPFDPMDGEPLRYRRIEGRSFVLYSAGENCLDDGGDPSPARSVAEYSMWDGRDVIWPRAARMDGIAERIVEPRMDADER